MRLVVLLGVIGSVITPARAQVPTSDAGGPPGSVVQFVPPEPARAPDMAGGQTAGLTLSDLEQMAMRHNPVLARAAARVQAAYGRRIQAGLYPNPVIAYLGEEIGDMGTAGQQGGFVRQEFVTAGKLRLGRAVASQGIVRAEQLLVGEQVRVLTDVRTGYYDILVAQRRIELTERLMAIGAEGVKTAEALLKAKEASRVDVLQALVELDSTGILLANARNRHRAVWRMMAAVVGMPDMLPTPLLGDLEDLGREWSWDGSLQRLLSESPELAAARAEVQRARWAIRKACAERIPNLKMLAGVQKDNSTGDTIAGVELEVALPLFNRNQGNIARANAELLAAQRNIERIELNLQRRLAETFEHYASTRNQVEKYRRTILPNAKTSLDLVAIGYQQGEFDYVTLLTAQRTYFRSNLAYLESLRESKSSSEAIEGLLLSDSLGSK